MRPVTISPTDTNVDGNVLEALDEASDRLYPLEIGLRVSGQFPGLGRDILIRDSLRIVQVGGPSRNLSPVLEYLRSSDTAIPGK